MTKFFTSDTHFSHGNIIKHSKRPFINTEEMDAALIYRWNERINPQDEVYHVGDFCFGKKERCEELLQKLNGHKFLIRGNHDEKGAKAKGWVWVGDMKEIHVDVGIAYSSDMEHMVTQKLVLCHYAMRVWNGSYRGVVQLHGHSHGTMMPITDGISGTNQQTDVGVDCWDFKPVTFPEIAARLIKLPQTFHYDHHQPRGDIE